MGWQKEVRALWWPCVDFILCEIISKYKPFLSILFTTLVFFQEGTLFALLLHKTVAEQVPNDEKLNLFVGISPL